MWDLRDSHKRVRHLCQPKSEFLKCLYPLPLDASTSFIRGRQIRSLIRVILPACVCGAKQAVLLFCILALVSFPVIRQAGTQTRRAYRQVLQPAYRFPFQPFRETVAFKVEHVRGLGFDEECSDGIEDGIA